MLGILPGEEGGPLASLADAHWLADALTLDNDAPVGVSPAVQRNGRGSTKCPARIELDRLTAADETDVATHLYRIRNSRAHGKTDVHTGRHDSGFGDAARALPIVNPLARVAVDATA